MAAGDYPPLWRNWAGTVRFRPRHQRAPASLTELQFIVRETAAAGRTLRVAGSGHSFVPLVQTDALLLSLDALSGVEGIDGDIATVLAGTRLHALGRALAARGYGMQNLGDINQQALAGAVATGTHGTGLSLGCLSTQVQGLNLVTADGRVLQCSAEQQPDIFAAARVSLGALGVVTQLQLRVQPAYRLQVVRQTMSLQDCLAAAPVLARQHRHIEFYWIPHTQQTLVKCMDPVNTGSRGVLRATASDLIVENLLFGTLSRLARQRPAWAPLIAKLMARGTRNSASTMIADCHRAFATRRLVRFQEMEYELPAERGPEALRELEEFVRRKRIAVHFPVEYRYVAGDDIWLSPFHGRDSASISVHQYIGMDTRDYFAGAEAIFRAHGGRPHWGKLHSLRAPELAKLYPRWDDFMSVRARLDPHGVFLNEYLRMLFGID